MKKNKHPNIHSMFFAFPPFPSPYSCLHLPSHVWGQFSESFSYESIHLEFISFYFDIITWIVFIQFDPWD